MIKNDLQQLSDNLADYQRSPASYAAAIHVIIIFLAIFRLVSSTGFSSRLQKLFWCSIGCWFVAYGLSHRLFLTPLLFSLLLLTLGDLCLQLDMVAL